MKLILPVTLLLPLTLSSNVVEPQLYISPSPSTSTSNIKLTSPQSNAILSHHLSVSNFEILPHSINGNRQWESLLFTTSTSSNNLNSNDWLTSSSSGVEREDDDEVNKIVIILECGKEGCSDFLPTKFDSITPNTLPSLPLRSWTSVLTLHLTRLTNNLGLNLNLSNDNNQEEGEEEEDNNNNVYGLNNLIKIIKSTQGWKGWVGEELGNSIGWNSLKKSVKTSVQADRSNSGKLTDLDLLDSSADELIEELEALVKLTDSINAKSIRNVGNDDGPQSSSSAKIVALHLSGMKAISKVHSPSSVQYQRAALLLKQTLSGTLASISASMSSEPTILLLTLPPYSPPLLQTRKPWLTPFNSGVNHRYTRRSIPSTSHGRVELVAKPKKSPVIPSGSTCFGSAEETVNMTASCLGRGEPILGLTTRGKNCWVCNCLPSEDKDGRIRKWAGEGCEKEDVSSQFVLLFFSSLGLLIVLFASVMLLAGAGSGELPGTLSSVGGGMSGQSKKD